MQSGLAETCHEVASGQLLSGSRKLEQKQGLLGEGSASPPASCGKRKLPAWQTKNCKHEEVNNTSLSKDEAIHLGSKSEHSDPKNGQRAAAITDREKRAQASQRANAGHKTPPSSKGQTRAATPRKERNPKSKATKDLSKAMDIEKAKGEIEDEDEASHVKEVSCDASLNKGGRLGGVGMSPESVRESSQRIDKQISINGSNLGQPSAQSKLGVDKQVSKNEVNVPDLVMNAASVHRNRAANSRCNDFSKFLDGVVFAISGLVNPERADVRDKALQMGAQYRPDWGPTCTLLVCAYANTPKFNQVKGNNGTIVSKDWILECFGQRKLLEIDSYLMHPGKPWRQPGASADDVQQEDKKSEVIVASLSNVRRWACEDVKLSIGWLQRQETQPEPSKLKMVAIEGIQLCLDDVVGCIRKRQSIKDVLDTWEFVPRAVRELAAAREESTTHDNFLHEAERLKWIYTDELKKIQAEGSSAGAKEDPDGNCTSDDDATEIMSGDDEDRPNDAHDSWSHGTQVLDDDAIQEAQEVISKMGR